MVSLTVFIPLLIGVVFIAIIVFIQKQRIDKVQIDPVTLRRAQQNWVEPKELKYASPPRPVQLNRTAKFSLAFLLLVTAMLIWPLHGLWQTLQKQQDRAQTLAEGPSQMATLTRKWVQHYSKNTNHLLGYTFTVDDKTYNGQSNVPEKEYSRHNVGETLPLHYSAADPKINGLTIEVVPPPPWVALVFYLIPLLMLLLVPVSYRKYWQLLVSGRTAPGIVLKVTRGKNGYIVHYEFCDDRDRLVRGRGNVNKKNVPQQGDTITVLYLRNESKKNTLYPNLWIELKTPPSSGY